ncbi:hypothetical protein Bca4012_018396 [Brassica carinata]
MFIIYFSIIQGFCNDYRELKGENGNFGMNGKTKIVRRCWCINLMDKASCLVYIFTHDLPF